VNNQLIKQSHWLGLGWGAFKLLLQHTGAYIQILILMFSSVSAYYAINQWVVQSFDKSMPFVFFATIVVLLLVLAIYFEWKLGLPSTFIAWNNQWWEHRNPLREEVKEMKEQLNNITKLLENMNEKN